MGQLSVGGFSWAIAAETQRHQGTKAQRKAAGKELFLRLFFVPLCLGVFVFLTQCFKVRINVMDIVIGIFPELREVSRHRIIDGEFHILDQKSTRRPGGVRERDRKLVTRSQRAGDDFT